MLKAKERFQQLQRVKEVLLDEQVFVCARVGKQDERFGEENSKRLSQYKACLREGDGMMASCLREGPGMRTRME